MQRTRLIVGTLMGAVLGATTAAGAETEDIKIYLVRQTTQAPTLDGKLDDACWANAEVVDDFGYTSYYNQNRKLAIPRSEARFLWDKRYLYVGLVAFEKDIAAVRRVVSNPGTMIFWRDLFEVHIDANHDRKTRFQLMANPNEERYVNATFDRGHTVEADASWGLSADWTLRANYGSDRWTLEIKVSLADMGLTPHIGTHIGLNVARFRFVEGTQFLCWNGQGGSHHALKGFATCIFVAPGRTTTSAQALRLAYPDVDRRVVRLLRGDGYTILDHGKARDLTFAQIVTHEADRLRAQLDTVTKAIADAKLTEKDKKSFDRTVTSQRRAVDKVVTDAAVDGRVNYVRCRKAIELLKPIATRVGRLTWQMKALVLSARVMR